MSLHLVQLDGSAREVEWDHVAYPYLASVHWSGGGPALVRVLSRDQRDARTLALEPAGTRVVADDHDDAWIDLVDRKSTRLNSSHRT